MACAPRADVLAHAEKEWKEKSVGRGVTSTGGLFEVLVSEDGAWTVLLTTPAGLSCLIASGQGWRALEPSYGGET